MGFVAGTSNARKETLSDGMIVTDYETAYEKNGADGSLALVKHDGQDEEPKGAFYHSLSLPSGIRITGIRALVSGTVTVSLKKETAGDTESLATMTATDQGEQTIEVEDVNRENPNVVFYRRFVKQF